MVTYAQNKPVLAKEIANLRQTVGWNRMEKAYSELSKTSFYHICAYDDGVLIGYIDSLSNGNTDAYIQDLMVAPSHQGKGVGTELMNQMITALKEKHIFMVSVVYEEQLKPFYSRFGMYDMLCSQLQTYDCD